MEIRVVGVKPGSHQIGGQVLEESTTPASPRNKDNPVCNCSGALVSLITLIKQPSWEGDVSCSLAPEVSKTYAVVGPKSRGRSLSVSNRVVSVGKFLHQIEMTALTSRSTITYPPNVRDPTKGPHVSLCRTGWSSPQ